MPIKVVKKRPIPKNPTPRIAPIIPPIMAPVTAIFDAPNFLAPIMIKIYSEASPHKYKASRRRRNFYANYRKSG
jgi:hypothetical protein